MRSFSEDYVVFIVSAQPQKMRKGFLCKHAQPVFGEATPGHRASALMWDTLLLRVVCPFSL